MTRTDSALDLIEWLNQATLPGADVVRERVHIPSGAWVNKIRPDCNIESIYAFLRAWVATGDAAHLTKSRAIWEGIKGLQGQDGSWPFSHLTSDGWDLAHWINDNSEVSVFLLRAAELDAVNAAEYRAAALRTTDWLLATQDPVTKMWRSCEMAPYQAPYMAAHACTALARAYALTPNKAAYLAAIESGLGTVIAGIRIDHRIITGYEIDGVEERWRPPSSEQSICVRAFAVAARLIPGSEQVPAWHDARHAMLQWLTPLVHESGAMRNGYGLAITAADVAHITDHVYTTAFAVEAYQQSYRVDGDPAHKAIADGILDFAASNIWYSAEPDKNGCLRGAYDLTAQDFDTSEVSQNGNEEGGGNMAYTGWSAAPVASLLFSTLEAGRRGASTVAFL